MKFLKNIFLLFLSTFSIIGMEQTKTAPSLREWSFDSRNVHFVANVLS